MAFSCVAVWNSGYSINILHILDVLRRKGCCWGFYFHGNLNSFSRAAMVEHKGSWLVPITETCNKYEEGGIKRAQGLHVAIEKFNR